MVHYGCPELDGRNCSGLHTILLMITDTQITWDDVPEKFIMLGDNVSVGLSDKVFMAEDAAKCFCCGGWFPLESCVVNYDEELKAVPVCETCAEGRF